MVSAHEPVLVRLDLQSQAFKQNPLPTFARMREVGPLIRTRMPLVGAKMWMTTTYEAVNELLRDHHRFVQSPAAAGNRLMGSLLRWLPGGLRPLATHMLMRDEPDHRRLRTLVEQAFVRQNVEAMRPRLETLADETLDRLAQEAAGADGSVDLLAHFARPYPLAVICELLDLPAEDRARFTRWASSFGDTSLPGVVRALRALGKLMRYVRDEVRRQTERPRAGLLAALIQVEQAGDRLSEDELLAMVFLLLAAGHLTTLHQVTHSVLTLLDHREQLDELRADWTLADSAVQELLRFISFAQVTKPRYAHEDTEFFGHAIRRGQMLMGCLASANHDPAVFQNPERLDIHRHPNRHVEFGAGIHVCLGARLARVETAIALERLFTRFPNLDLAIPRSQIRYSRAFGTRDLSALPVTW
jgi:cytochrome P450